MDGVISNGTCFQRRAVSWCRTAFAAPPFDQCFEASPKGDARGGKYRTRATDAAPVGPCAGRGPAAGAARLSAAVHRGALHRPAVRRGSSSSNPRAGERRRTRPPRAREYDGRPVRERSAPSSIDGPPPDPPAIRRRLRQHRQDGECGPTTRSATRSAHIARPAPRLGGSFESARISAFCAGSSGTKARVDSETATVRKVR